MSSKASKRNCSLKGLSRVLVGASSKLSLTACAKLVCCSFTYFQLEEGVPPRIITIESTDYNEERRVFYTKNAERTEKLE